MTTRGSLLVTDFLVSIKQIVDELTALGDAPSDANLLVYTTHGLGLADHSYADSGLRGSI